MLLVPFKKSLAECELTVVAKFLWTIKLAETLTSLSSYLGDRNGYVSPISYVSC
jgi:hypothetical protein